MLVRSPHSILWFNRRIDLFGHPILSFGLTDVSICLVTPFYPLVNRRIDLFGHPIISSG